MIRKVIERYKEYYLLRIKLYRVLKDELSDPSMFLANIDNSLELLERVILEDLNFGYANLHAIKMKLYSESRSV